MIKKFVLLFSFSFVASLSFSQAYWQQEVNYKIEVKLDDKTHTLSAFESFEYINNSPDQLTFLYVHLWPNAYQNEKTALGKQLYKMGENDLKFGGDSIRGNIDSLNFKVDGQSVKWEYDSKHVDICKIYLNQPLPSKGRITVTTPFKVKIPSGEISRLGHIGQSYQITQWYPKPAVYDKNGWNQIPYLTQGEFYSEYGSFDVSITVPKNYVIGATGDLQTASEIAFLDQLAEKSLQEIQSTSEGKKKEKTPFPASDAQYKTIRYTQKDVHDFAWFADKRFQVLKGEVELPHSKRKVTTWAMFVPENAKLWSKAIEYLNDGTYYYSLWNGDYPYNQVTAVDGTISAGGGMEYPNVTVIGNCRTAMELEIVIVHEVGHNWFYGILGSNERVHGWMDEGLNTLNEMRYIQTKYPDNTNFSDMVMNGKFHLNELDHHDMGDISYRMIAMLGEDQPIETHSADFTSANYGIIMYQKTGLVFFYLRHYLGEEKFDKAMSTYFETYKFKHPQPEDLRRVLEQNTGKNLAWLFEDLIQTTNHIDYKIKCAHRHDHGHTVKVKNVGQVDGPISVEAVKDGKVVETVWVEPGAKKSTVELKTKELDYIQIDVNNNIPEMNRTNNTWISDKIFHRAEPIKFEFMFGDNEKNKNSNFWSPVVAYNNHDKFMLGAAVHNYGIPFRKFQYLVVPMYSFGRNSLSGTGELSYSFHPKKAIKVTRVGMSLRSFKNDNIYARNESYYAAAMPYVSMKLGNRKGAKLYSQNLLIQTIYRNDQFGSETTDQAGGYVKYDFDYTRPNHQFGTIIRLDYINNLRNDNEMSRASLEATYRFRYLENKMKRWIELRAYIGGNISYQMNNTFDNRYMLSLGGANGFQDVFLEDYFFDRTRTSSVAGINGQRLDNMGGFRTTNNFGSTTTWLTAANVYVDLPLKPGIFGVFADFGGFDVNKTVYGVMNTGIGVRLGKTVGIYFPVWMSKNLADAYSATNAKYGEKIRFTFKMNIINKPFLLSNFI